MDTDNKKTFDCEMNIAISGENKPPRKSHETEYAQLLVILSIEFVMRD